VNHVRASPDGKYVFSAGDDGCLFVFAVTQYDQQNRIVLPLEDDEVNYREFITDETLGDVFLMNK
jgi:hypothetical protein